MEKPINPAMFQLARESRGLTQKELSELSGISQGFISKFEKGPISVSDSQLYKLSTILDYPESFFFQEGNVHGLGISSIYHRKRKNVPLQALKLIQAEINKYNLTLPKLINGVELKAPKNFCVFDIDDHNGDATSIADMVRGYWRIPLGPIDNMVNVIEQAGGIVIMCDFKGANFDAESVWFDNIHTPPFFFVNKDIPTDRLRFTLAHELGHIIMHHNIPNPNMETQANIFASEFLMPKDEILEDFIPFSLKRLIPLKLKWKVSIAALLKRAFDIGVIIPSQYKNNFSRLSMLGYRKKEPLEIEKEEPKLLKRLIDDFFSMFLRQPKIRIAS